AVALGEDAARGVSEASGASRFEATRPLLHHPVPASARVVLPVAGAGVDEHEPGHALRMGEVERKRAEPAERGTYEHGLLGTGAVEQSEHPGNGELDRVLRRVVR